MRTHILKAHIARKCYVQRKTLAGPIPAKSSMSMLGPGVLCGRFFNQNVFWSRTFRGSTLILTCPSLINTHFRCRAVFTIVRYVVFVSELTASPLRPRSRTFPNVFEMCARLLGSKDGDHNR